MPARIQPIRPGDINPHWKFLCEEIGERRAGSIAEHRSAQYIRQQFQTAGLSDPRLEAFECDSLRSASASLEIQQLASWIKVPCEVLVGSPSTQQPNQPTEMDLVWAPSRTTSSLIFPVAIPSSAASLLVATTTRRSETLEPTTMLQARSL